MSAPAPQGAQPARAAGQTTAATGQATAAPTQVQPGQPATQGQPGSPAQQPAPAQAVQPQAAQQTQGRTTPTLLRWARTLATAAALLTGITATGTFDTGGVNATPDVIASRWEAGERAGAELAAARLEAARGAAESLAGVPQAERTSTPQSLAEHLDAAADWTVRSGADASGGLVQIAVAGQEAMGAQDAEAARAAYQDVAERTDAALTQAESRAQAQAEDLRTGSRSTLTALVGGASTLLLLGILVWLALRTRRIVNIPLLVATAITAGLTYVSLNPSALPLDVDQRVDSAALASQALQDVRLARAAQYAQVLGRDGSGSAVDAATASVRALGDAGVRDAWADVAEGQAAVEEATSAAAGVDALSSTQARYDTTEGELQSLVADRLDGSAGDVGRPALLSTGLALLLGIVAAGLAWGGITQRLRDYR